MRNFFEQSAQWKQDDGALHLYVLPSEDEQERLVEAQQLIDGIDGLPLMPGPYLHLTLQRLAQFDDELTQADLSRLGSALTDALRDVPAFDLVLNPPRAEETAVVVQADPSPGWDRLHAAVAAGLRNALTDDLPSPPHGPHLSLAYANAPVDDSEITARLAGAEPLGSLRVDAVHLVSVTKRPEKGIFDFTHLANWDLA